MVERHADEFRRKRSFILLDAAPDLRLECDPLRMEQVLVNLISNALKYGSEKEVKVSLKSKNETLESSVEDFGIGIPVESQERIFNRFERLVPHTSISGMGLGLYIVRQLVQAHHGNIVLKSEMGVGSKFTVVLPKIHAKKS